MIVCNLKYFQAFKFVCFRGKSAVPFFQPPNQQGKATGGGVVTLFSPRSRGKSGQLSNFSYIPNFEPYKGFLNP